MPFDDEAEKMLQSIVDTKSVGLFSWDIENGTFEILETITGRTFHQVKDLEGFIRALVFKKDLEMALQDIRNFMKGLTPDYESTFRVLDAEGKVRWLFCKGTVRSGNNMYTVMYDMTKGSMIQGHDVTTNLINETTFMCKLKLAVQQAIHSGQNGTLLYISIDNFHTLLNQHGFEIGRSILYRISRILLEFVGDKDELAKFPYNKFMLLLADAGDNYQKAEKLCQEIQKVFETPIHVNGQPIYLKINMGLTFFPEVSADVNELIRISGFAVNHSRESGGLAVTVFDSELMTAYNQKLEIENELPLAILNQELYLVFQPQLNLKTNKIRGLEVLVRWENKKLGVVSPADFVPVAEDKGYIVAIGRWVRNESLKTARNWLDKGLKFEKLSINISSIEILQPDFKERLLRRCERYDIPPEMIELEVTERVFMHADDAAKNMMDDLLKEGFRMALDDFGTGYSNLRTLLDFDIHTLKIDQSLIKNIENQRMHYIIKGIRSAKNYLYQELVAEGVEDKKTLKILSDLGFDHIQGYYFSKPLSKIDLERFVLEFPKSS